MGLGGADGGGSMDARATIKTTMWRWARGRTQPRLIGSEEGGEEIDLYVLDTIRECLPLRATSLWHPSNVSIRVRLGGLHSDRRRQQEKQPGRAAWL